VTDPRADDRRQMLGELPALVRHRAVLLVDLDLVAAVAHAIDTRNDAKAARVEVCVFLHACRMHLDSFGRAHGTCASLLVRPRPPTRRDEARRDETRHERPSHRSSHAVPAAQVTKIARVRSEDIRLSSRTSDSRPRSGTRVLRASRPFLDHHLLFASCCFLRGDSEARTMSTLLACVGSGKSAPWIPENLATSSCCWTTRSSSS
jgi:hypothetical protein